MDERVFLESILTPQALSPQILIGRGDDAAVVRYGDRSVVFTTDSFIEGRHFDFRYFSPQEVGAKAVEAAASDIVAMGARPQYVLWSLVLGGSRPETDLEFYRALAQGVEGACGRISASLIGGNLAKGLGTLELTMTVIGELQGKRAPCLRSGARAGDLVCVTGQLGASSAGLRAYQKGVAGFDESKRLHRTPRCRLDVVDKIGAHATSMIDVTDGLSSELHYLSAESKVRIEVDEARFPIHPEAKRFAAEQNFSPLELIYAGGEDYELLFTLPEEKARLVPATIIGRVLAGEGVFAKDIGGGVRAVERSGYDHLKS